MACRNVAVRSRSWTALFSPKPFAEPQSPWASFGGSAGWTSSLWSSLSCSLSADPVASPSGMCRGFVVRSGQTVVKSGFRKHLTSDFGDLAKWLFERLQERARSREVLHSSPLTAYQDVIAVDATARRSTKSFAVGLAGPGRRASWLTPGPLP